MVIGLPCSDWFRVKFLKLISMTSGDDIADCAEGGYEKYYQDPDAL